MTELEERMVTESWAVLDVAHPRPVHWGEAIPGALADAMNDHLPLLHAAWRSRAAEEGWPERVVAIGRGERPWFELDLRDRELLNRLAPELDALLDGTRRANADLPLGSDLFGPRDEETWLGLNLAGKLAGLRVREALAMGDADRALATCVDGLALARDAAIAGGLIGAMQAALMTDTLAPGCASAVDGASDALQSDAAHALHRIRVAHPSVCAMLRVENVSMDLLLFGPTAGPGLRDRLGPRAHGWLAEGERQWPGRTQAERERLRASWPAIVAAREDLARLGDLSPSQRDDALERWRRRVDGVSGGESNPLTFVRYARRMDGTLARLDALELVLAAKRFRAVSGRWPRADELLAEAPAWLTKERLDVVTTPAGALRLAVRFPKVVQSDEEERPRALTVELHATLPATPPPRSPRASRP